MTILILIVLPAISLLLFPKLPFLLKVTGEILILAFYVIAFLVIVVIMLKSSMKKSEQQTSPKPDARTS